MTTRDNLLSNAKQFDYYASVTTGDSRARWLAKAAETRVQAAAIPNDFVEPVWQMPEWGTRGT
jgi:hypothetical protein